MLVALASLGLTRVNLVAKKADVKEKEAAAALETLHRSKRVDRWPTIKAWKITEAGLVDAAAIESRPTQTFQWTWNKRGVPHGS